MPVEASDMAHTVKAMRPVLPAKNFEISKQFYIELGFRPITLGEGLVEMFLGTFSFILQDYYVEQWANNFVMHMRVSDLGMWWDHICTLDLTSRYGVRAPRAPKQESWGLVACVIDPSGVLWQIAEISANNLG